MELREGQKGEENPRDRWTLGIALDSHISVQLDGGLVGMCRVEVLAMADVGKGGDVGGLLERRQEENGKGQHESSRRITLS